MTMELIRGIHNIRDVHRGCVATIGNFDGVHRGHQAVLQQLRSYSREHALPSLVIVFEPQPREFFRSPSPRLTRFREKYQLLKAAQIDRLVCVRFDEHLAALSATQFVEQVLVGALGVKVLVIGDDFRFGKDRSGDVGLLRDMAASHGFEVIRAATFVSDGERVSSTLVREVLAEGDLAHVERLLGRPYSMSGRIVHGDKRGRTIGFPTANIDLHRMVVPISGIYAARLHGLRNTPLDSVAYIGWRPIVDGTKPILEVHIFDFDEDCYGRHVRVEFVSKLRDDADFESFEALKEQIRRDCQRAREVLAKYAGT